MQGILFEQGYLRRMHGAITHSADVALTELVANAWDAGASKVSIFIPSERGQELTVEDDGSGMTPDEFKARWMTLGYNRLTHQGNKAEFPPGKKDMQRWAYGRNGVGRHGMLCFADQYEVETWKGDTSCKFGITTTSGEDPFSLIEESCSPRKGHGTKLSTVIERNLPDPNKVREILAVRFLHDPRFAVLVNGKSVPHEELPGMIDKRELYVSDDIKLDVMFFDAHKAAKTIKYQGVAFWIGNRLVGEPSWALGNSSLADGRTHFAKRYTVVIRTEDLFDELQPDWTGFKRSSVMDNVYSVVEEYIRGMHVQVSTERIQETQESAIRTHRAEITNLKPLAKIEVAQFVQDITTINPSIQSEQLNLAVKALINLEQSRSGASLLKKLSEFSDDDIEGLDRLLSEWTLKDALTVLDEIDRRIVIIEAIKKLSSDPKVEELKTLHPLVTGARWLFGPEYDTPEYASNLSLKNAVNKVLGTKVQAGDFINHRKRPDLLILEDSSISAVAIENIDTDTGLSKMSNVLIIELKRGGSEIGRDEMHQANDYLEDIMNCGHLDGRPFIRAFVVGHSISTKTDPVRSIGERPVRGKVQATSFGQLVRTAEARLFKLRERLDDRYEEIREPDLIEKVFGEPEQQVMELESNKENTAS